MRATAAQSDRLTPAQTSPAMQCRSSRTLLQPLAAAAAAAAAAASAEAAAVFLLPKKPPMTDVLLLLLLLLLPMQQTATSQLLKVEYCTSITKTRVTHSSAIATCSSTRECFTAGATKHSFSCAS
jgi:hypothetical protein